MNRARIIGGLLLLCETVIYLVFSNEISGIVTAIIIGLWIGIAVSWQFGKN